MFYLQVICIHPVSDAGSRILCFKRLVQHAARCSQSRIDILRVTTLCVCPLRAQAGPEIDFLAAIAHILCKAAINYRHQAYKDSGLPACSGLMNR